MDEAGGAVGSIGSPRKSQGRLLKKRASGDAAKVSLDPICADIGR